MFEDLMYALKVEREGPAGPALAQTRAMADKAYSSKAIRTYLRGLGIECVIPKGTGQWVVIMKMPEIRSSLSIGGAKHPAPFWEGGSPVVLIADPQTPEELLDSCRRHEVEASDRSQ